jgi:hypothetical protein
MQKLTLSKPYNRASVTEAAQSIESDNSRKPSRRLVRSLFEATFRHQAAQTRSPLEKHWCCNSCGVALGRECVSKNTGGLLDGRLLCSKCLAVTRELKAANARQYRFKLLLIAFSAIVTSVLFLMYQRQWGNAGIAARNQLEATANEVGLSLAQGDIVEAMRRRNDLEAFKHNAPDGLMTDAGIKLNEADRKLNVWLQSRYGDLSPDETKVLLHLLCILPAMQNGGVYQIQSIRISKDVLFLALQYSRHGDTLPDAIDQSQHSKKHPATGVLAVLFDSFSNIQSIELEWRRDYGDAPEKVKYHVARSQLPILLSGADPLLLDEAIKPFQER